MTGKQVLAQLRKAGTAQNRKIYGRHGVGGPMFGVSFAALDALRKQIKIDHDLALRLWASGNHDARVLATMIGDAGALTSSDLDRMAAELDNYVVTDAFVNLACRTRFVQAKAKKWTAAAGEWKGQAGWNLVGALARDDADLADSYFEERLRTIEEKIGGAKNRTRHAMNNAVINIGVRNAKLRTKAEVAARRIGKVAVDHGQTSCKTPDIIPYIARTVEHQKNKAARARARKASAGNKATTK